MSTRVEAAAPSELTGRRVEEPAPSEQRSMRAEGRLIHVAVPVPQIDPLTYSVPDEFPDPAVGARVLVSVGKRVLTGIVVGAGTRDSGSGIRGASYRSDTAPSDPGSQIPDPGSR